MSQVSDKIEKIERDLYELRELVSEVKHTTCTLNDKIDIVKEVEKLVERIQVKREEDKEKVKQFLLRKFSDVVA
jgi:prefoldin subunit 5